MFDVEHNNGDASRNIEGGIFISDNYVCKNIDLGTDVLKDVSHTTGRNDDKTVLRIIVH